MTRRYGVVYYESEWGRELSSFWRTCKKATYHRPDHKLNGLEYQWLNKSSLWHFFTSLKWWDPAGNYCTAYEPLGLKRLHVTAGGFYSVLLPAGSGPRVWPGVKRVRVIRLPDHRGWGNHLGKRTRNEGWVIENQKRGQMQCFTQIMWMLMKIS